MRRRAVPGEFRNPQGISIDRNGNIVVIVGCTRPPHVQVFKPDGEYRNDIAAPGPVAMPAWSNTRQRLADGNIRAHGDFDLGGEGRYPIDSAIDDAGRVLILDGHRVKIFDIKGKHSHSFGAAGWAEEDFISPCGLAAGKKRIVVTDNASRNPHEKDERPRNQV